ncbi:nucleotide exchange factor GrpE [Candidatus Dependentiae bacterium]|nr:nucleotide exchange factor GrpE [Candidatus Dependentiae bacterium]
MAEECVTKNKKKQCIQIDCDMPQEKADGSVKARNYDEVESNNEVLDDDACCVQLEQIKNTLVHVTADFENFKKRTEKEKIEWIVAGKKQFILDVLEIVDDFDRALQEHKKKKDSNLDAWLQGFELIGSALYKLLEKHNVYEIKNTTTFDPELHEALTQVESDEHTSGNIVMVLQKGFMFDDVVLRPAKVSVAK